MFDVVTRRSRKLAWAEPGLLILHSLAAGPKHGYVMVQDIAERAGVTLGPGTLYAALSRLEHDGFVEALAGDDRRRPYRMTAEGQAALEERLVVMRSFAASGLARLKRSGQEHGVVLGAG